MSLSLPSLPFLRSHRGGLWNVFAAQIPVMATVVLGFYFFLATSLPPLFVLVLLGLLSILSFVLWPRFALCLLMAAMLFQYFWIGVFMDRIANDDVLHILSLTNPLVTNTLFLCACVYIAQHWRRLEPSLKKVFVLGIVFTGLSLLFAIVGSIRESFDSAFQYFRNYSGALIYLTLGMAFGMRLPLQSLLKLLVFFGILLGIYGFVEMCAPYDLYSFVHLTDFFHMKFSDISSNREDLTFYGIEDTITFLTVPFLNLSGKFGLDFDTLRLVGPLFHFISYGYALAFFFLVAIMVHRRLAALFMLPVFIMIGAKGALVLIVLTLLALAMNKFSHNYKLVRRFFPLILAIYAGFVLLYGFLSNDNHFEGLMACLKGFVTNPIGHGVGVGGNMSDTSVVAIQGGQNIMASTENFPAESAIGVLMYQMGILGILSFLAFWRHITRQLYGMADKVRNDSSLGAMMIILPAAITVLLVNAFFQEEVFIPTGWGLWMFLVGIVLAHNTDQKHSSDAVA